MKVGLYPKKITKPNRKASLRKNTTFLRNTRKIENSHKIPQKIPPNEKIIPQKKPLKNPQKKFRDQGIHETPVVSARVLSDLTRKLKHEEYLVRLEAVDRLREIVEKGGDISAARPALESAANDYNYDVKRAARFALAARPLMNTHTQSIMCTEEKMSIIEPRGSNGSGVWMIPVKMKKATEPDSMVEHSIAPKVWDLFKELEESVGGGIAVEILQEASNGTVEVANGGRTIDVLTEVTHTIVAGTDALKSVKTEYAFYQSDIKGKGMNLYIGKKFDERTDYLTVKPAGKSRDGSAIRAGIKRLEERPEQVKILIVVNRARPSGSSYNGPKDTGDARKEAEARGIKVLAITTPVANSVVQDKNTYYESLYGKNHAEFTSIEELPEIFEKFLSTFEPGEKESVKKINIVEELTKKLKSHDYYARQYAALDLRDIAKSGGSIEWARTALIHMRDNDYTVGCRRAAGEALKAFDESRSKQNKDEDVNGNVDLYPAVTFRGFDLSLAEAIRQNQTTRKKALEKIILIAKHGTTGMDHRTKLTVAAAMCELTGDKNLISGIDRHVKSNISKILKELSNDSDPGVTTLSKMALDGLNRA